MLSSPKLTWKPIYILLLCNIDITDECALTDEFGSDLCNILRMVLGLGGRSYKLGHTEPGFQMIRFSPILLVLIQIVVKGIDAMSSGDYGTDLCENII